MQPCRCCNARGQDLFCRPVWTERCAAELVQWLTLQCTWGMAGSHLPSAQAKCTHAYWPNAASFASKQAPIACETGIVEVHPLSCAPVLGICQRDRYYELAMVLACMVALVHAAVLSCLCRAAQLAAHT